MMSTQESQQQRSINNTGKLERLKRKLAEETNREEQLLSLKTKPLPELKPSLKRAKNSKCNKCNVKKNLFLSPDDVYIEPIDALTMTVKSLKCNKKWSNWINISLLRNSLAKAISTLAIHPAEMKMLKNLKENYSEMPLIFVVDKNCSQFDLLLINFVLLINGLEHPIIVGNKTQQKETGISWAVKELNLMKSTEDMVDVSDHLRRHGSIIVSLAEDYFSKVLKICKSIETFLVPVSINSERIDENFSLKLFGNESLGIVKLTFNEPYVIKDFMKHISSTALVDNEAFIKSHLRSDIEMKRPIMSSNVVAFLLLTEFRDGTSVAELTCKLNEFREKHWKIDLAFEGESIDIIEHALELLGNSVDFKNDFVSLNLKEIIRLSSYARPLVPHFALKSILVISALSLKKSEKYIDFNDLIKEAQELCDLLQCELLLTKPCNDLVGQLDIAFDQLSLSGILTKPEAELLTCNEQRARRIAYQNDLDDSDSDYDDGYQSRNPNNEVTINIEMMKELDALKDVTMAIIEAYLSAAYVLKDYRKFSEKSFIERSTRIMREELEDGKSKYWESCSKALMKSCLEWLKLCSMVEIDGQDLKVHPDFDDKKSIKFLINRIERFIV